jgi:hypothetical protein
MEEKLISTTFQERIRRGEKVEDIFEKKYPDFERLSPQGHRPDFFSRKYRLGVQVKDGRKSYSIQQMSWVAARDIEEKFIRNESQVNCVIIWWTGEKFIGTVPSKCPFSKTYGWWQQDDGKWRTPYFQIAPGFAGSLFDFDEILKLVQETNLKFFYPGNH